MNVLNRFSKLYSEKKELAMLEWAYLLIVAGSVVVAGILALFDQALGTSILVVPLVAFIAMSMNIVAWALIKLAADTFLEGKKPAEVKPKNAKK